MISIWYSVMCCLHRPFASAFYCINIWYPYDILLWDMIGPTKERRKKCKACTVHELPAWTLCLCILLHKHMISIWYSVMGYDRSNKRKRKNVRHAQCMSCLHGPFASALYCINIWYPYDILLWDMIGPTKERRKKCKACTVHELLLHGPFASAFYCINIWYIWYSVMGYDRSNKRKRKKCKACTVHELPAWTLCLCIILHKHMISIWYSGIW